MTMARKHLVDVAMTRYYHCISRCVRRPFLCGEGFEHRKDWIEARLQELAGIFSVDVCGFAEAQEKVSGTFFEGDWGAAGVRSSNFIFGPAIHP